MKKEENYNERGRAPKGHFVVYVGEGEGEVEKRRFVVPLSYLRRPPFQQLLEKAAEEFGFVGQNNIVLPCNELAFRRVMELAAISS